MMFTSFDVIEVIVYSVHIDRSLYAAPAEADFFGLSFLSYISFCAALSNLIVSHAFLLCWPNVHNE